MLNGGADLNDVPFHTLYHIAYSEMYRQIELVVGMAGPEDAAKAFEQIDAAIGGESAIPEFLATVMPVGADGAAYDAPDVSPPDVEPMPPPGAKPGKPVSEG